MSCNMKVSSVWEMYACLKEADFTISFRKEYSSNLEHGYKGLTVHPTSQSKMAFLSHSPRDECSEGLLTPIPHALRLQYFISLSLM